MQPFEAAATFGAAMRKPVFLLSFLLFVRFAVAADLEPGKLPVEITATGETTYHNGIATAQDNVAIHFGDTDIYSDYAQYDSAKHQLFLKGNVRVYRGVSLYITDTATYNLDTKAINATDGRSSSYPYLISGQKVTSISDGQYLVHHGTVTTDDTATPDFQLKAKSVRIYENDRVIMKSVTFYIGKVPIFYWPYLYQSLDQSFSYAVAPAFLSSWGPSLLGRITFPIGDNISTTLKLDYRSRRGEAIGFDSTIHYGKDKKDYARLSTYYLQDQNPLINRTSLPRGAVPTGRYRLSLQDRTHITDNLEITTDITKLSDPYLLQDFFESEFRVNPVPDNNIAVTETGSFYTLTGFMRYQVNPFFETTERLPEVDFDVQREPIFGNSGLFYEGETSAGELRRSFPDGSTFDDYSVFRADTFHQLSYPNTYFGWLSIVPRVGIRETYYSQTRDLGPSIFPAGSNPLAPEFPLPDPGFDPSTGTTIPLVLTGDTFRTVINAGAEASFKISREWEDVQTRTFGLDGLRHIIQPFADFSWVSDPSDNPLSILQFDRYLPSTKLPAIDFPEYTAIDSLDNWTIARVGVRNRLQTRRDDTTINWLELDTFFDVNIDNPFDRTQFSNVFNNLTFTPLPWMTLVIDSQLPLLDKGFTEIDSALRFQPVSNLQISVGHRYLNDNPYFLDSSLLTLGGYYRINDNWGIGGLAEYEETTNIVEEQRYTLYRDLSSWVASLGAIVRNNGSVKEYGVLLSFTVKAFPKFNFDLNFDPGGTSQSSP
ncbi:MAG TPA: LPS assembly protein LptD [Chthoniobacterales bacterium]|nr:LPS assembly protein LptD [Chthoniobacterales bacterium]